MRRTIFDTDHDAFRDSVRTFISRNVVDRIDEWESAQIVPRELFTEAGAAGFLGMAIPEEFGGGGVPDFRFNMIIGEEFAYAGAGAAGLGLTLHNDICLPYLLSLADDEQKKRWLPGIASGEIISAIAMTEPGVGSDLANIATTAIRDGDEYVLNGSKTFITNGINSDLVIVAAKTDPRQKHKGLSLIVVERGMAGFDRGRNLAKLGLHSQDTAELFFDDVRVPASNLLGEEGKGFAHLMQNLPQERLSIGVAGVAAARAAFDWTKDYVRERKVFGNSVGALPTTRHELAQIATEVEVAQHYVDQAVLSLNAEELSAVDASMAKLWCTELQGRTVDRCLQLFGGYGFMLEYPIARAYADARVTRIYGGTSEIMKEIIGRSLDV
ncbi:acyl-CoA dehydrogenase family protein [Tomitella fengzijianii]|uniref:Acyl-[acyl-carrier-protein] dehydrogenase MbtN n=1 Tax=Tomitella fengzijianii TaxID=2597660 RepID=A0A516X2X3_9ACTN|nr:acyl-CoA dehydrogenase family protein [Tomitella fengzijianii]QDQ96981.1 acyl-CoA dehydrogenase [Tomitella fengzijianii]